jgi:chromosome segregation ATPase
VADTLEKRVADLEYLLTHLPEDLDARFAGVDVKLAGLRELILLQNGRITKLEARLNEQVAKLDTRFTELSRKVDAQAGQLTELSRKVDAQASQLAELSRKVDGQGAKLDEILARLPKP